ncbi:PREDICTED: uncharacterized protein LOC109205975 [Nicotiana attenuata]|uniref:uncharacterized protein LOC109205975 n=1 Tax=Nicotiana attenuata TaxID=49451 RepID=UPI000905B1E8|nr:PREDICTED: uncharacterized protein LOC109205975 [Nicotiana attenuata]
MNRENTMSPSTSLDKYEQGKPVDEYRGMIGSLLYLTATRPDIMFSVSKCARIQSAPKESHLTTVKRIIRYLIGTISHELWYPHSKNFNLEDFSDADLAGDKEDRKSTSGTCQVLEKALICWNSKKQGSVALSTTEAEYIAIGQCCAQLLWMSHQLVINRAFEFPLFSYLFTSVTWFKKENPIIKPVQLTPCNDPAGRYSGIGVN